MTVCVPIVCLSMFIYVLVHAGCQHYSTVSLAISAQMGPAVDPLDSSCEESRSEHKAGTLRDPVSISFGQIPRVGLLDHMAVLFLILEAFHVVSTGVAMLVPSIMLSRDHFLQQKAALSGGQAPNFEFRGKTSPFSL